VTADNICTAYASREEVTGNIGLASVRAFQVTCLFNVKRRLRKPPQLDNPVTPKQAVQDLIACYENERIALAAKYAIEMQNLQERQQRDLKSLRSILELSEDNE
jgi:hypothetical protein